MFGLLFEIGPAITVLLKLKYEIKEKYFYELTNEQYKQLEKDGEDITKTWYMILPDDYNKQTLETLIVTENQKQLLLQAQEIINQYGSDKEFDNYEEKLKFVTKVLPPVFLEGTKFKKTYLKFKGDKYEIVGNKINLT